MYLYFY